MPKVRVPSQEPHVNPSVASAPGYIRYKGRHIAGAVQVITDYFGKDYPVLGFEPSAEHLGRFEEPEYFE